MENLAYVKLPPDEVETRLEKLVDWGIEGEELAKTYHFKAYKDGAVFAAAVAYLADALDHHPNILVGYKTVRISVNTHSVGGISPYDFELARRIDGLQNP